jgi:hypothetical protein
VLPRRSAPVVLGLVVTSLVTMLTATQLVTESLRPSFQGARPVELLLGSLGAVQAEPTAAQRPPARSAPAAGPPAAAPPAHGGPALALPPVPEERRELAVVGQRATSVRRTLARARATLPVAGPPRRPCPTARRLQAAHSTDSCRQPRPEPAPPRTPDPGLAPPLLRLLPRRPAARAPAAPSGPPRRPCRSRPALRRVPAEAAPPARRHATRRPCTRPAGWWAWIWALRPRRPR